MTRLLGLDVGDRRVGMAVGDDTLGSVRSLAILRRRAPPEDAERLARIAADQQVDELVVGLPLDMDGGEGEQARLTRAWASEIASRTGLPVTWRDERLTTETAESLQPRLRRDRATGRPTRASIVARRGRVDREAAVLILRSELDRRASAPRSEAWTQPSEGGDRTGRRQARGSA